MSNGQGHLHMLRASWSRVARARDKLQCGEKRGCRDAIDAEDQMPIVLDDLQLRVATEPHTSLVDRNGTNVSRIGIYSPLELRHIVKLESCVRRSHVIANGRGTSPASFTSRELQQQRWTGYKHLRYVDLDAVSEEY